MPRLEFQPHSWQCVNVPEYVASPFQVWLGAICIISKNPQQKTLAHGRDSHTVRTVWHLSHPVPTWLLQHLTRGQHLYLPLAWASKGKILLSCCHHVHQRHKCSFNSIPQQKGLINLLRQNKEQTPKLGQNSRFRWKSDLTGSEERDKLTSQKKFCYCWKARDTINGVNPLVVPYMPLAGRQSVNCVMLQSLQREHQPGRVPTLGFPNLRQNPLRL